MRTIVKIELDGDLKVGNIYLLDLVDEYIRLGLEMESPNGYFIPPHKTHLDIIVIYAYIDTIESSRLLFKIVDEVIAFRTKIRRNDKILNIMKEVKI